MDGSGQRAPHDDPGDDLESAASEGATAVPHVVDRALRPALELAVNVVAAGSRQRPPRPVPPELRPFLRSRRLPEQALAVVRAVLDADSGLRNEVAMAASPELVDPVGRAWLAREDGWRQTIAEMTAAVGATAESGAGCDVADELRRERRRRASAEAGARRASSDLRALQTQLETEQAAHAAIADDQRAARRELERIQRNAADHAHAVARAERREAAAVARAHRAERTAVEAEARAAEAIAVRDAVLADRAAEAAGELHEMVARLPAPRRSVRAVRTPVAIPGGVYGDSAAAAEFLLRVPGALALVDGYNVAKLGWPGLELEAQREQCIAAAEDIARRWATRITVVFDGAAIVGAAAARPRRLVRVVFSPEGVLADDVLRREVSSIDVRRPVVVVTNDLEVVVDVRAEGANVLTSQQFLAAARR